MRSPLERLRPGGEPGPPDFIGVGALGSGTGWWHALLLQHPEIRPPHARRRRRCTTSTASAAAS